MTNKIQSIFERSTFLLSLIDKVIYYFRIQNYDAALRSATIAIDNLGIWVQDIALEQEYFNKDLQLVDMNILSEILGGLLMAQENKDYVLLADLYEIQIVPFLYQLQETIISREKDVVEEEFYKANMKALEENNHELAWILKQQKKDMEEIYREYHVEFTSCGLKTLNVDVYNKSFYLHSNKNVLTEAFTLARSWYQEDQNKYIVYGLGFGYHIAELAELDDSIEIDVYESDLNLLRMACAYTDINSIARNPKIHIYYDPDFMKLVKRLDNMQENAEFVIHYPSLCLIKNLTLRDKMETYFIHYSSQKNQRHFLNANFRENIENYDEYVDTLKPVFKGKDLYIVAAGPSLDKNFRQLKQVGKDGIILATGTVFRKLCNEGIRPDYFLVSDAYPRVYAQIAGVEQEDIPMLFLSTAFKGFAKQYQGKKYLICQNGYDKSEEFAELKGFSLYNTGGSVTTTALDIGIQLGCRRIIFLGLDLGFPDNLVHAEGTSRRDLASTDNLIQVTDIQGNLIYTTKILNIYRKWIENRIQSIKDIEVIDATEGGARIAGTTIKKLSECL